VWSYKTGNSVCSSAAVAGGILFIGSNDGHLYAFNATTGKIVWSYKTGSGVGSPAVVGGVVFVGAGGKVYAFGQAPTYSVSFSESGLPKGVQWAVTFNGQTKNSTSKVITFNATIGVYPFSITPPLGYVALPSAGSITVNGVSLTEQITFKAIYEVSFVESSLPQGVQWSVTFNGQTLSSTSNSIGFIAVNGVYFFSITPPTGHSALPSSGTIIVDGTDVTQQIMFIPMSVSVSNIRIIEGDTVNVNITLGNEGNDTETFNVTLYDNQNGQSWRIYMFTDVALAPSSTITLSIDGLDFGVGSHTLTVNACSLIGPTYTCTSASIVVASIGLFRPWIWHHLIQV
jgi:outer membrane protein assembly factor BamB